MSARKAVAPRPADLPAPKVRALAADLSAAVKGEVRFDAGSRALYAHDLSIYRQVPIGVVVPRDVDDAIAAIEVCHRHEAPVLPRGAGTSLVGQCTNTAVVLDFSKYVNRILELDPDAGVARVEPGVICDQLKRAAEPHGLTYGPDPATHAWCTFGGMLGNNSCGVHSILTELHGEGARTSDQVEELTVLTYDGHILRLGPRSEDEIARAVAAGGREGELVDRLRDVRDRHGELVRERFPDIPRRVSGYNLDDLLPEKGFHLARALVGSEGTCATILDATVRLADWPPARTLLVAGYPDHFAAADDLMGILAHRPIGLEGFDGSVTETMAGLGLFAGERALLPEGDAWLLAEFGGETEDEATGRAEALAAELRRGNRRRAVRIFAEPAEQAMVWLVRESALGASRIPGVFETWPSFEDSAVHPSKLGAYLRDFAGVLDRHGLRCVYFGHYGQGCVHCRINFDLRTREGIRVFKHFLEDASERGRARLRKDALVTQMTLADALLWLNDRVGKKVGVWIEVAYGVSVPIVFDAEGELHHWRNPTGGRCLPADEDMAGHYSVGAAASFHLNAVSPLGVTADPQNDDHLEIDLDEHTVLHVIVPAGE